MFDLDRFLDECRGALRETHPQAAIQEILNGVLVTPRDLERAFGVPSEAGLNLLYQSRDLTVFNFVWAPGMSIWPHEHRMWAVIGLYGGREENVFYRRGEDGLQEAGGRRLDPKDTIILGKDIIHSVTNPLREFTGAIHVYGGDFFRVPRNEWDPETKKERPYDPERTKKLFRDANEAYYRSKQVNPE
jgi:predicted metal-dependent enzyme (double-stranded beta helix superfamily)